MSYIGQNLPSNSFIGYTTDTFAGDGSATTFTMSKAPFNESAVIVVINNVVQQPTADFTISGTTLTIDAAVASGDVIYATHTGGAIPINTASALDLNGASDQLILDADGDTTISADTDDQIDIKIAGADDFQFTANTFTAQSGSTITTPTLGVVNTKDLGVGIHIKTADSGAATHTSADELVIENAGHAGISILSATDSTGNIYFNDSGGVTGYIQYDQNTNAFDFGTNGSTRLKIDATGNSMFNTTSVAVAGNAVGVVAGDDGYLAVRRGGGAVVYVNRFTNDGTLIKLHQAGTEEGNIAVSGSTVSYNAFTGGHWSRLADNSKPTILRGTIMDSIDEMCDWYQAVADVAESTDDNGNVTEAHQVKESIPLGDKSVGDAITFTSEGTEYTGKIVKEGDVKHVKSKVSDTAGSKKVYGVFQNWDDADDGLDGDVNDMNIAQVGTYIIRVHKDITVSAGDLLVSNGDGTAKKQDDDIIRSKTVAKVNSNVKVETYDDGSYTVPCTLHC